MTKLYEEYRRWARVEAKGDGVIVGADISQEWLLPWWWDHYRRTNDAPVTFVDFGMTDEKRDWCRERGLWVALPVTDIFVAEKSECDATVYGEWEKNYGKVFWESRNSWFKKPLACLLTSYRRSIWIDLDCEVRDSIEVLFPLCDHEVGLSMARDVKKGYNSGVLVFRQGIPLIETWADGSFERNRDFRGDQEVLSRIIEEQKLVFPEVPQVYNWSRLYNDHPDVKIYHLHGCTGKDVIHFQMIKKGLLIS